MHSKNTTPTPSRPCRQFVRLSRHSRACTRRKPEDRTLRRRAGALRTRQTQKKNGCRRISAEGEAASGEAGERPDAFLAPARPLLPAVRAVSMDIVSNKIKRILEHLDVSRNEYVLKRITVKDFSDDFYLLFLPIIPDTEFVYPRCVFEDMYDSGISKVFNNRTEYYSDPNYYYLKMVALKKKYKSYDLLYPQGGDFFFSERIIDAMQKENIVGYDIIKGGCFYEKYGCNYTNFGFCN